MLQKNYFSSSKPYAMIALLIFIIIFIACVCLVINDLSNRTSGVFEQSDENKKMIERENEMLASRMIDYSENKNQ